MVRVAIAGVIGLQLFFLNALRLNGDEAIYLLLTEEIAKIKSGVWPGLNPVIDYAGPLDFWMMGSVYWLTGALGIPGGAWMVRIVPFFLFWVGTAYLTHEIARISKTRARLYLLLAAITPMTLVFSRVAFPHGLLLGGFSFLLAEVLRATRTREIRIFRMAGVLGLCAEAHSTAFFGAIAIGAPLLPVLTESLRDPARRMKILLSLATGTILFLALSYPVLRNFPPPVADLEERGGKFIFQLRSLVNVVTGYQPYQFLFGEDLGTAAGNILVLLFLSFAAFRLAQDLRKSAVSRAEIGLLLAGHVFISGLLLVFCHRGRSLEMLGHERYFLAVVPGWLLLQAHALERVKPYWIVYGFAAFQTARFFIPLAIATQYPDPSLLVSQWLVQNCPKSSCIALVDNFWNYWPIRYFSRDSIAVKAVGHNWKTVPLIAVSPGARVAACWFETPHGGGPSARDSIQPSGPSIRFENETGNRKEFHQVCQTGTYR